MRRISLAIALTLLGMASAAEAQESPIVGSWITVSWEGQQDAQPGLVVFTETNYSMMFVPPGVLRERWEGEAMTQGDMVAAFETLVANSGRYTREGDQITTEAYVALNPNYMFDWGSNHVTYTFRVEGDLLYLTWPDGFMDGADSPGFKGTFRKVG